MKNILKSAFFPAVAALALTSCQKSYSDLYNNPNTPTSSPASLVLTGVLSNVYEPPFTINERWSQYFLSNYSYYALNFYNFGPGTSYYGVLENVVKMQQSAAKDGLPAVNAYASLGQFFKAYLFAKMSMEMGDIPVSQSLAGTGNLTPAYDPQKMVFQQVFKWLDSANNNLASLIAVQDKTMQGDFYFNNDLTKWQKLTNTLRLRLLIDLSKKSADADLNIAQQFTMVISNPGKYPIMQDATDNWQFVSLNPTNKYPNNPDNFGNDASRYNCSSTYLGLLTQLQDPRVFVTAEPAAAKIAGGANPTDFAAFVGADPGEDQTPMSNEAGAGAYSFLNRKHYYDTYTGEPSIQVGYPELCFNIAEAINRGWIVSGPAGGPSGSGSSNAEDWYKAGIIASMNSYSIPLSGAMPVYFLHPGASLGSYDRYSVNVDFANVYYPQTAVKYSANAATALNQIMVQKYLALFRHSGLQSYYNYRRTGVPTFTTGSGTGNNGKIPLRFQYPTSEISANAKNYNAALQAQFGGTDDINQAMWILK